MRVRVRIALAVTAAAVLVGVVAAYAVAGRQIPSPVSFTVVERTTTDTYVDGGEEGPSTGDLLTYHNRVYDETNATQVGTDQGFCMLVVPKRGKWECTFTTFLADGQITVQGPFFERADSTVLAVTGGTGLYSNARGEMGLSCDFDASTCTFAFSLIP